jgi:hypothetical protein
MLGNTCASEFRAFWIIFLDYGCKFSKIQTLKFWVQAFHSDKGQSTCIISILIYNIYMLHVTLSSSPTYSTKQSSGVGERSSTVDNLFVKVLFFYCSVSNFIVLALNWRMTNCFGEAVYSFTIHSVWKSFYKLFHE